MLKQNYEVQITINGKPAREFYHEGKYYVEAREGSEFQIKIKNNSFERIVAVPSVDGLSVIDGEEASYNSRGYIINAYDSMTIDGWRKSDKEVAKFVFTDKKNSYSVKRKKGEGNIGVIGVAIFPEKVKEYQITYYESPPIRRYNWWGDTITWSTMSACSSISCSSTSNNQSKSLGTGWGNEKKSEVQSVGFERADYCVEMSIFYATAKELINMGISLDDKPKYISPEAFPGNGYCQPPIA